MSDVIIPDEWLIHDLRGDNGEESQRVAVDFLGRVVRKCDRIAILRGSPFADKILALMMKDEGVKVRRLARYFRLQFIQNSKKCVVLPSGRDIGVDLSTKVPAADRYLFETREALGEGLIVTADSDLFGLEGVRMRAEFLREYR
ncbi:MAG: hypothetical protein LYZ69_07155 [Nitrososphaerales archaeon]|nr:hypothetical protein [Nitrososphaerales archaeon]